MASKLSSGFTLASELLNPDAVYCVGVTCKESLAAISVIERDPLRFSPVERLEARLVGEEILALLPRGEVTLDADAVSALLLMFGPKGKFPAVHIESGRLGG